MHELHDTQQLVNFDSAVFSCSEAAAIAAATEAATLESEPPPPPPPTPATTCSSAFDRQDGFNVASTCPQHDLTWSQLAHFRFKIGWTWPNRAAMAQHITA